MVYILKVIYGGDFRPYFTIQDFDLKAFGGNRTKGRGVLGVTNRMLYRAYEGFPNVMCVGKYSETDSQIIAMSKA